MFKRVLIPVDVAVERDTQNLLRAAKLLISDWECEAHVLSVIPNVGMAIVGSYFDGKLEAENYAASEQQLSDAVAESGLDAQQKVLTGRVYDSVISYANDIRADLIVIGAHQPELKDYLLGANAARVVRHASQSVLVVRNGP